MVETLTASVPPSPRKVQDDPRTAALAKELWADFQVSADPRLNQEYSDAIEAKHGTEAGIDMKLSPRLVQGENPDYAIKVEQGTKGNCGAGRCSTSEQTVALNRRSRAGLTPRARATMPTWCSKGIGEPTVLRRPTTMADVRPIHEVCLPLAQDILYLVRDRGLYRIQSSKLRQPLKALAYPQDDGSTRLLYERIDEHDGAVEFHVTPGDTAHVVYGDEHILKSENLPSVSEVVDARNHDADVEVNFRDLFGKSDSSESEQGGGASVKVTIESEQGVEGVASFKEAIETEAHAEFSETEGTETSQEQEGEEGTTVHAGKRARITETRQRADGEVEITANGHFVVSTARRRQALRRQVRRRPQRVLGFAGRPAGRGDAATRRATCIWPTRSAGARSRSPAPRRSRGCGTSRRRSATRASLRAGSSRATPWRTSDNDHGDDLPRRRTACRNRARLDGRPADRPCLQKGVKMTKATGRLILLFAIVALIGALIGINLFLPASGMTVQIEEAGLIGALIAGLSSVVGYYFKD